MLNRYSEKSRNKVLYDLEVLIKKTLIIKANAFQMIT